jgi:cell division protein ZapA
VSKPPTRVSVRIMEKDYLVACGAAERPALLAAAELVNLRMWEVQQAGRVVGPDRIAVTVALNLANELLQQQRKEAQLQSAVGLVRTLRARIEAALENSMTIESAGLTLEPGVLDDEDEDAPPAGATLPVTGYTPP